MSENCSPGHSFPFPLSSLFTFSWVPPKTLQKDGEWLQVQMATVSACLFQSPYCSLQCFSSLDIPTTDFKGFLDGEYTCQFMGKELPAPLATDETVSRNVTARWKAGRGRTTLHFMLFKGLLAAVCHSFPFFPNHFWNQLLSYQLPLSFFKNCVCQVGTIMCLSLTFDIWIPGSLAP